MWEDLGSCMKETEEVYQKKGTDSLKLAQLETDSVLTFSQSSMKFHLDEYFIRIFFSYALE